jgi:uncharacterized protein
LTSRRSRRAVFDTNIVVSAFVFGGRLSWLQATWADGVLKPVVCKETVSELIRVLAYPKFRLQQEEREALLEDYLPFAETARLPEFGPSLPDTCRDRSDEVFIRLAISAGVEALITGDSGLLKLRLPVPVLSPAQLLTTLAADRRGHD